jgi:toxin ParE1/3/4
MPRHQLVLAPAAISDLGDIYQYGLQHWGQTQSEKYLTTIREQFWSLAEQPLLGTERSDLLPGTRVFPMESHTIFYRVSARRVEIIRIVHGRQDPKRHLK